MILVVIEVRGGNIVATYTSDKHEDLNLFVVDWDNISDDDPKTAFRMDPDYIDAINVDTLAEVKNLLWREEVGE